MLFQLAAGPRAVQFKPALLDVYIVPPKTTALWYCPVAETAMLCQSLFEIFSDGFHSTPKLFGKSKDGVFVNKTEPSVNVMGFTVP